MNKHFYSMFSFFDFKKYYLRFLFLVGIIILPMIFAAITKDIIVSYSLSISLCFLIYTFFSSKDGILERDSIFRKGLQRGLSKGKFKIYESDLWKIEEYI